MNTFGRGKGDLITFENDGSFTVEGQDYTRSDGTLCEDRAKEIVAAMGGEIESITHKPEYCRTNQGQGNQVQL